MPHFQFNLTQGDSPYEPCSLRLHYDGQRQGHILQKIAYGPFDTEISVAIMFISDSAELDFTIKDLLESLKSHGLKQTRRFDSTPAWSQMTYWYIRETSDTREILDQLEFFLDEFYRERRGWPETVPMLNRPRSVGDGIG